MVNQARQDVLHSCKWGSCKQKFNTNISLWKHVEQHVDNAIPRLTHMVNDDDVNRPHIIQPAHINTSRINPTINVNLMRPVLNSQSTQQTRPPQLQQISQMLTQVSPTITYNTLGVPQLVNTSQGIQPSAGISRSNYLPLTPQFQQMVGGRPAFLIQPQQRQRIQSAGQSSGLQQMIPLGSMPNPITIDDSNFVLGVDPPIVNHQRLGRPPASAINNSVRATQMQKKVANINMNSFLSQNTKK
ncbi:2490_t:CDS:2 [Funneliformis geosporum]|uniref:12784_t:CDS:1 n=1 Tax=Funneliformis geosporum TaxID=1117311 RepID=A0A9W4SIZ9_9GLOM|nr:2490_t:CDS:2 [Funneliformis geosporum]CAI2170796.1 12784_t:CDS:2 [Funneliformis geosporum]